MSLERTYERFVDTKQSGRKAEARRIAEELIRDYRSRPDPEFVYRICEQCEHKLDFVIWKEIVLPLLSEGLADDPRAVRGMIQTIQNLYSSRSDWEALSDVTEAELTVRLLEMRPADPWARERRIEQLQKWLSFTIHEWPSGVLYGMDGATVEQCDEILEAVAELRDLDGGNLSNELCDDVNEKTRRYKARLIAGAAGGGGGD